MTSHLSWGSRGAKRRGPASRETGQRVLLGTLGGVWSSMGGMRAFRKVNPGSGRIWFLGRSAENVVGAP